MNPSSHRRLRFPIRRTAVLGLALGFAIPAAAAPASGEVEADGFRADPDALVTSWGTTAAGPMPDSEFGSGWSAVSWPGFGDGLQPDEQEGTVPGKLGEGVVEWSSFRYFFVAGAAFVPRTSATGWSYPGVGCKSAVADGNDVFNVHLDLPSGVRIDFLRLFYYDTSGNDSTSWVTTYNGAGTLADVAMASSAGTAGYGTSLSDLVEHVVDTFTSAYVLNWRSNQVGTTMQLCGMRVAYREPL